MGKGEKKESGIKKIFVSIFSGILFGLFAAISFYAVLVVGEKYGFVNNVTNIRTGRVTERVERSQDIIAEPEEVIEEDTTVEEADIDSVSTELPDYEYVATTVVTDVTEVVSETMPSMVTIASDFEYNYYYYSGTAQSLGSGIIIGSNDDELLIVTNYHVIEDTQGLTVTFCDDTEAYAQVKGTDVDNDLAVISVKYSDINADTQNTIKIATMGDSDNLTVGEPVVVIGNALGYGTSVTTGIVSALNREMDWSGDGDTGYYIQTDAAINQGNSGGAMLNLAGEVVGINSNKIGGSAVEGMGYAIPISYAKPIIEELMLKVTRYLVDEDKQACLGISGATVSAQEAAAYGFPEGVYIANVYENSAAERAGFKKGDFIVTFDGEKITSMEQLQNLLKYYEDGEKVQVVIYRYSKNGYKKDTVVVTLGNRSEILG